MTNSRIRKTLLSTRDHSGSAEYLDREIYPKSHDSRKSDSVVIYSFDDYVETKKLVNVARGNWKANPICVICGVEDALTNEHIPPEGTFLSKDEMLTVPSCLKCQDTPDREFRYTIACFLNLLRKTKTGKELFEKVADRLEQSDGKLRTDFIETLEATQERRWVSNDQGLRVPIMTCEPSSEYFLPVLVKIVAGLYWLFEEGNHVLANEVGTLIIQWDVDGNSELVNSLLKKAHLGTKVADGQFIALRIQAFEDDIRCPLLISLHFHSSENGSQPNSLHGYHAIAYILLDKLRKEPKASDAMDSILKKEGKYIEKIPTSCIKTLVQSKRKISSRN